MRADAGLALFFSYWVRSANLWVDLPSLAKPLWKQADMCFLGGSQSSQIDSEDDPTCLHCRPTSATEKGFLGVPVFENGRMLSGFCPHCKTSPVCTLELWRIFL